MVINMELTFKLEVFEGPLDLLLFLISKNKVDIEDIPIALILEQFLEYINTMQGFNMEIASEFITMAAQLVYIKSKMILPKYDDLDEEDPRDELASALEEYQQIKQIAAYLGQNFSTEQFYCKSQEKLDISSEMRYNHKIDDLTQAMNNVFLKITARKPLEKSQFSAIVHREPVPVEACVANLLTTLSSKGIIYVDLLLKSISTRSEAVGYFLAILELLKNDQIYINIDSEHTTLTEVGYDYKRDS